MQGKTTKPRKFFTPLGLALFILSLFYIVAEAVFNMQLLEVAGSVKSKPDEIDRLQYFGRSISAYGFTLLVLGLFSSTGFRLQTRKHWMQFIGVSLACLTPFALIFSRTVPELRPSGYHAPLTLEPLEIMASILPLLGFLVAIMGAGRFRPQMFVSLVLLAWPAMFLGQKLLIESYVIDKTIWKDRQNARYMLMLRAGLEDCILHLGDLQLCNDSRGTPDMKAARIVVSALWMLSPESVLQDLQENRDAIVESAASRGIWFSPTDQYNKYIDKVAAARNKYEKQYTGIFHKKYYQPYKQASEMYMRAMDEAVLGAEAREGATEVEKGMEEGWKKYKQTVFDFQQTISVLVGQAVRQGMVVGGVLNKYCTEGSCPDVDLRPQIKEAQLRALREFRDKTGYPPDIQDKNVFLQHPKTLKLVREQVQDGIRDRMGVQNFTLPKDWAYDRASFEQTIKSIVRGQVHDKWLAKFGTKVPPGLDEKSFMALLGIDLSIPPVDQLVMSEEDFFRKYVVPGNQKLIQTMLDDLTADRKKYHDSAVEMEAGKDYVEALYVPTISLVVSLAVVLMTVMRGLLLLPNALARAGWVRNQVSVGAVQGALAGALICVLLTVPRLSPNPYASGATFQRYLHEAQQRHPAIARILSWAVHVQPVIYRAGSDIRAAVETEPAPVKVEDKKEEPKALPTPDAGAEAVTPG